ncbi:MAG: hypothetical protein K6U14_03925 [Firmicutes bacterium]|nr:hypothetical protein [Alicyclobacillaceae bacterium]MCL6496769.1 hypothetical protein [Bacillota bacterium]
MRPRFLGTLTELTPESLAAVAGRQRLTMAQDYCAQDRVRHRLHGPRGLVGRLFGYQGYYIPVVEAGPDRLHFRCDCGRSQPCAHAVALAWAWVIDPQGFAAWDRLVLPEAETLSGWTWLTAAPFPWERVPERPEFWLRPPTCPQEPPWAALGPTRGYRWLKQWATLVHPAWWEVAAWRTGLWASWESQGAAVAKDAEHWVAMAWHAPEIPWGPLWPLVAPTLRQRPDALLAWLGRGRLGDPALWPLRVERMLEALEWAVGMTRSGRALVVALRRQYAWADPDGLGWAGFLVRQGRKRAAVRWLERRLPTDPERRRAARALLIAWTEGEERLGHQIADALEHPAPEKWAAIAAHLDPERWQTLRQGLRVGATPAPEPE